MANAVGGLIVFGVEEDGAEHAEVLGGVRDSARHIQSLRAKAAVVRPFIPALRIYPVPLPTVPGREAIVVDIPRSPEAPHLVAWDRESWRYPMRRGAVTDWLGENDLESAYASRFARRADSARRLNDLTTEVAEQRLLMSDTAAWIRVAAICSVPTPLGAAEAVDRYKVEPSVSEAISTFRGQGHAQSLLGRMLHTWFPSVGLRRGVVSSNSPYSGISKTVHLELHLDGSFVGALQLGRDHEQGCQMAQDHLEMAVRDLVVTAIIHANRSKGDGVLQLRVDIGAARDVSLGQFSHGTIFDPVGIQLARGSVVPVTSEAPLIDLVNTPGARDQLIKQLATDLVQQFAVPDLLFF